MGGLPPPCVGETGSGVGSPVTQGGSGVLPLFGDEPSGRETSANGGPLWAGFSILQGTLAVERVLL